MQTGSFDIFLDDRKREKLFIQRGIVRTIEEVVKDGSIVEDSYKTEQRKTTPLQSHLNVLR